MIFETTRSSNLGYSGTIEINTLEELLELTNDEREIIVINNGNGEFELEFYDDYRES